MSLRQTSDELVLKRNTSTFYQNQADLPVIAYNLGDNKICIQNTLQMVEKKMYILPLKKNEKFVCFLNFNSFEEIGFYPDENLKIESCSHFAYMTTGVG